MWLSLMPFCVKKCSHPAQVPVPQVTYFLQQEGQQVCAQVRVAGECSRLGPSIRHAISKRDDSGPPRAAAVSGIQSHQMTNPDPLCAYAHMQSEQTRAFPGLHVCHSQGNIRTTTHEHRKDHGSWHAPNVKHSASRSVRAHTHRQTQRESERHREICSHPQTLSSHSHLRVMCRRCEPAQHPGLGRGGWLRKLCWCLLGEEPRWY